MHADVRKKKVNRSLESFSFRPHEFRIIPSIDAINNDRVKCIKHDPSVQISRFLSKSFEIV